MIDVVPPDVSHAYALRADLRLATLRIPDAGMPHLAAVIDVADRDANAVLPSRLPRLEHALHPPRAGVYDLVAELRVVVRDPKRVVNARILLLDGRYLRRTSSLMRRSVVHIVEVALVVLLPAGLAVVNNSRVVNVLLAIARGAASVTADTEAR